MLLSLLHPCAQQGTWQVSCAQAGLPVQCSVMSVVCSFQLASEAGTPVVLPVQQPVLVSAADLEGKSPFSVF